MNQMWVLNPLFYSIFWCKIHISHTVYYTLHILYNIYCTPRTIHMAHFYNTYYMPCTIHTRHLVYLNLAGCLPELNSLPNTQSLIQSKCNWQSSHFSVKKNQIATKVKVQFAELLLYHTHPQIVTLPYQTPDCQNIAGNIYRATTLPNQTPY